MVQVMVPATLEQSILDEFCLAQQLPASYIAFAQQYFLPLATELKRASDSQTESKLPLLIGINGCQGSGKSTLSALLEKVLSQLYDKKVANLSIDDFYHTKIYRHQLAQNKHPLFATRGVPGTHDIALLEQTLSALRGNKNDITIPRFNKAIDDRYPDTDCDKIKGPVDIILLEGWCIGANAQSASELLEPINALERTEDKQGTWRTAINEAIKEQYHPVFAQLDSLIMLKAPSFECVYQWRQLQEEKLRQIYSQNYQTGDGIQANHGVMDDKQLKRFIQHYQRLTEHMLRSLPEHADIVFDLNQQHQITGRTDNGKQ